MRDHLREPETSPYAGTDPGLREIRPDRRKSGRRSHDAFVVVGVFALTVLSAYVTLNLMIEQYEAQAALLVLPDRETLNRAPAARNGISATDLPRGERDSAIRILASPNLLGQVVDDLGVGAFREHPKAPQTPFEKVNDFGRAAIRAVTERGRDALVRLNLRKRLGERDQAVAMLLGRLDVQAETGSDIITLRLRMADPDVAVRVEEIAIQRYLAGRTNLPGTTPIVGDEVWSAHDAIEQPEDGHDESGRTPGASELNAGRQELFEELQARRVRLAGLHTSMAAELQQIAELERTLQTPGGAEADVGGVSRNQANAVEDSTGLSDPRDAGTGSALDLTRVAQVRVILPPTASLEPVSPPKLLVMALALIAGLALSVGLALFFRWTRDAVGEDGARLEAVTGLRFLGTMDFGSQGDS